MSYLSPEFLNDLAEIQRLLAEAYEDYFARSDGYCKSSEGAISIHIEPYYWREDPPNPPAIEIYSYVLGPNRNHWFKNSKQALQEVRKWHREQLNACYCEDTDCEGIKGHQ